MLLQTGTHSVWLELLTSIVEKMTERLGILNRSCYISIPLWTILTILKFFSVKGYITAILCFFSGMYIVASMILVGLSCVMEVMVLGVHHHGENGKDVPLWARKMLIEKLGPCLLSRAIRFQSTSF